MHIPTPWHNAIVEIFGDTRTYICKAGLVRAELEDKAGSPWSHRSGYDDCHPRGGRFVLYRKEAVDAVVNVELPKMEDIKEV